MLSQCRYEGGMPRVTEDIQRSIEMHVAQSGEEAVEIDIYLPLACSLSKGVAISSVGTTREKSI